MADAADLQKKFDTDPDLSKRFLSDPVGVLKGEGVVLTPQQEAELQKSVSDIAKAAPGVGASKVDVSITVSVRF